MSFIADLLKRGLQKQEAEIYRSILGVDLGAGPDQTAVAVTTTAKMRPTVTAEVIEHTLKMLRGESFYWAGVDWRDMSDAERKALADEHGQTILDGIYQRGVERARQLEAEGKARAAEAEAERKEFLDYCAKQHPAVLEEFRRVRLVKSKLAKFAGVAMDVN